VSHVERLTLRQVDSVPAKAAHRVIPELLATGRILMAFELKSAAAWASIAMSVLALLSPWGFELLAASVLVSVSA
jgi:hypothetical protein